MACERKQRQGGCSHFQCPFQNETDHGFECVEIVENYCEVGYECIAKCDHSYFKEDEDKVNRIFQGYFEEGK